jgi:hypothetical protein
MGGGGDGDLGRGRSYAFYHLADLTSPVGDVCSVGRAGTCGVSAVSLGVPR